MFFWGGGGYVGLIALCGLGAAFMGLCPMLGYVGPLALKCEKRILRDAQDDNVWGELRRRFPAGMTNQKKQRQLQVSPLRRTCAPPVEMTELG
jgi:hypothetical protein